MGAKKAGFFEKILTKILATRGYWVTVITVMSFLLTGFLSYASSSTLEGANFVVDFIIVIAIIVINILFDVIGMAVAAADIVPFHAMASNKVHGAKIAIALIKNAEKVSSFCNDVVGDICGIISGAAGAYIIIKFVGEAEKSDNTLLGMVIAGLIAAITVGGKALGKTIAIHNSNYIVNKVATVLSFLFERRIKHE